MAYGTADARRELLDVVAQAIDELGVALAALGVAYEQLDERTADKLEDDLFGPVQKAYGRAQRTYSAFAARHGLPARTFAQAAAPAPSAGVKALVEDATDAVEDADSTIAELQDSMRPVEVGDPELRAGLSEMRTLVGDFRARSHAFTRGFGR